MATVIVGGVAVVLAMLLIIQERRIRQLEEELCVTCEEAGGDECQAGCTLAKYKERRETYASVSPPGNIKCAWWSCEGYAQMCPDCELRVALPSIN